MTEIHRFAIFPYLVTSEPISMCGVTFRDTSDVGDLPEEARQHLEIMTSLFYLRDHLQIDGMTYAYLPLSANADVEASQLDGLRRAQTFFAYVYVAPGYDSGPFYGPEQSSVFILYPGIVSEFSLCQEYRVKSHWPESVWPQFDDFHSTAGYNGILNWTTHISAIPGSRIYPPVAGLWLNYSQDLHSDLIQYEAQIQNWATLAFFQDTPEYSSELTQRILSSINWYNRSASLAADEDVSLLHLAIALESLFNLDPAERVTERFKETIRTLLGPITDLETWAYQFYDARSRIAHQGSWSYLHFFPTEARIKSQPKGKPYHPLTAYGRRIYRLCLNTILAGTLQAEGAKLSSAFVPNQRRLEDIRKVLDNSSLSADRRLKALPRDVLNLREFNRYEDTDFNLGLLIAVGKLLCKTFLETDPRVPPEILASIRTLSEEQSQPTIKSIEHFEALAQSLSDWQGSTPIYHRFSNERYQIEAMEQDISIVLWVFVEYAAQPHFKLQAWREDKNGSAEV